MNIDSRINFTEDKRCNLLFLGEGNFSYTLAVLRKHNTFDSEVANSSINGNHRDRKYLNLAKSIVCTDNTEVSDLENFNILNNEFKFLLTCVDVDYSAFPPSQNDSLANLIAKKLNSKLNSYNLDFNSLIVIGVDAMFLDKIFPLYRFQRIHFNFPMAFSSWGQQRYLIEGFFRSASQIQKKNERIYLVAPKDFQGWPNLGGPSTERIRLNNEKWLKKVLKAAYENYYVLIKKRHFYNIANFDHLKALLNYIDINSDDGQDLLNRKFFKYDVIDLKKFIRLQANASKS